MSETQQFNAADPYEPLGTRGTTDKQLLDLLMGQASPHLPSRVLGKDEKEQRIEEIVSTIEYLRSRYVKVLNEHGCAELAGEVGDRRRRFMDSAAICREIPDQPACNEIRNLLAQERTLLTAELLERLGFLPSNIFTRDNVSGGDTVAADSSESLRRDTESRFMLLHELLWKAGFKTEEFGEPEQIFDSIGIMRVADYPKNARLARWVSDANVDFDECIHDAFKYLGKLFKDAAPTGLAGQAYEQISGLASKAFIELILIILNKALPVRTRFESVRLLEWAVALFSLRRNPVFQAQRDVRARVNEILEERVWDESAEKLPVKIKPELVASVRDEKKSTLVTLARLEAERFLVWCAQNGHLDLVSEEAKVSEDKASITLTVDKAVYEEFRATGGLPREEKPVIMRARKVRGEIAKIMQRSRVIDRESEDRLIFSGREKSEYSIARKIFLLQLFVQKCQATLDGKKTGMSKKKARRRLRKWHDVLVKHGKKRDDIKLKPVGFDALDDNVGYSMSVNLRKPLNEHSKTERKRVTKMFREIGLHIAGATGLKNVHTENYLWEVNPENPKSVHGFRVFKVAGEYPVVKEVFVNGRSEKREIMVPVEIQLLPVETLLRKTLPGDVSDDEYRRRKAIELAQRLHPPRIAGKEVYPEVFNVSRFADALNRTADDESSMQVDE